MTRNKRGHMHVRKGKRVLVLLRDGSSFVDHFEDATDRYVHLRIKGKIESNTIRTLSIYKES